MKRRFIAACAVAAALSAATAGCTQGDGGPGTGQAHEPAEAGPVREPTEAENLRISDATEVLIKQCMHEAGFPYWTSTWLSLEESRSPGYVNDDVAWAREHGYGRRIQEKVDRARRANPNGVYRAELSPQRRKAYDKALDGGGNATLLTAEVPTGDGTRTIHKRLGGCSAEAERKLYGDPAAWFRADKAVTNLQPLYVPRIMRDEKFRKALAAWSRCMTRAGHPYPDPPAAQEASAQKTAGLADDEAFAAEKRVAVAEARCARESSLGAVARERETHYRNALPEPYGELIGTHRRLQRDAYASAAEITGPRA